MEVQYMKGVATRHDPESCVPVREDRRPGFGLGGEALTGERAGQVLSPDIRNLGLPTLCSDAEGNIDYGYPQPQCEQPAKPACLSDRSCSEDDMANFNSELKNYKDCINAFINKVNIDIKCARQRASEAAEAYNEFVKDI